jgi:hypothetical protein
MKKKVRRKRLKIKLSSKCTTFDFARLPIEHGVNLNKDHFHSNVPSSSAMPMPPGLLPVGELGKHVQMKGTHATYEM